MNRAFTSLPKLAQYLRKERPSALISAGAHLNIIAILANAVSRTQTKVVATLHSPLFVPDVLGVDRKAMVINRLMRRFYPHAHATVAVSQGLADNVSTVTGLARGQVHVIYNPVVTPGLMRKSALRPPHRWLERDQPPVLIAAGRLTKQKDFFTLIRAFELLHKKMSARLMILGEGEDRPALEALARDIGLEADVALPGFVENPYAYMSRAAAFVLSSAWEGLPTVLIEAMACGCSLVATDCVSGPAEILENGRYGMLVPVGDFGALAQAMEATLAAPTPPDVLRARAAEFSMDTAVQRYMQVLGLAEP